MKRIKKILFIPIVIFIYSSTVFALSYTSPNYTLSQPRIIVSGGKANSANYGLAEVIIGKFLSGKANSANYSLDATRNPIGIETRTPPNSPRVDSVLTPTNVSTQTLTGTKDKNTSIYINGYEIVPLNNDTTWNYKQALTEGNNHLLITARNRYSLESESVYVMITLDTIPPQIMISSPQDGAIVDTEEITLEGTVDGAGFSETITLAKQGKNTLTKTAQDGAGNTNSVSLTVYYYPQTLIGPDGGEVTSFDGKVKVIIPAGALSQDTYIRLLSVDKESLREDIPENHTLLSIVEGQPNDLNFNKDVQLIYTLDQAEVPGTAVGLGYRDSETGEINLTGIDSVVGTDGYTVNFSITHFSTYAALKNLAGGNSAPIGSGVEIPLPDMFSGAFSSSVPLTVPPGRLNMQPNLQLLYRSSNPNSWVGVGFSLNPGYIVRSTRLGPPAYIDEQDTFYFVSDNGTTELVHLTGNLYQAKIESNFTKFFKQTDDSWRVLNKDGSTLTFGYNDDSQEISAAGTFSWYLNKATDTNGNYIEYNYTKSEGKSYLSSIEYTGNENTNFSPTHRVEFSLESRDDRFSSYLSGAKIATTQRLSQIQVSVNAEPVWRYALEYIYSEDTKRSLLKSITQYGMDGKAFPTQTFSYRRAQE